MSGGIQHADLGYLSIAELSRYLRDKEISPVALVETILSHIEAHDHKLNAFITVTAEAAIDQAKRAEAEIASGDYKGPLHGIPISLKDIIETKGIRTSSGSMVAPNWTPTRDATVYAKLRDAGAVLVGKANLYEYAFSRNPEYAAVRNPWNSDYSSSGSSSGSAVSVASGMAYASIGTDTGGSGRAPANANSVVGIKPTFGRISRSGIVPLSYSLDHASVMTRYVLDSALVLAIVSGYDPTDEASMDVSVPDFTVGFGKGISGMRIGKARGFTLEGVDPEVESTIGAAAKVLESLGADMSDVRLPHVEHCVAIQTAIVNAEAATVHYRSLREAPEKYGKPAFERLDLGNVIPATAYIHAQQVRKLLRNEFQRILKEFEVVISPTVPCRIAKAETSVTILNGREIDMNDVGPEYTGIYNLTGLPAIVVPAGFTSEGTPIGLQIAGAWFDEATILQVAHAFEQATEWHHYHPPNLSVTS